MRGHRKEHLKNSQGSPSVPNIFIPCSSRLKYVCFIVMGKRHKAVGPGQYFQLSSLFSSSSLCFLGSITFQIPFCYLFNTKKMVFNTKSEFNCLAPNAPPSYVRVLSVSIRGSIKVPSTQVFWKIGVQTLWRLVAGCGIYGGVYPFTDFGNYWIVEYW